MDRLQESYIDLLRQFVSFRSVSTDKMYRDDLRRCALWLRGILGGAGFNALTIEGYGNPIIVAQYDAGKEKTVLIYGHYDVQPAKKDEGWQSEPFELTGRDGRYFARGVTDNKGLILMHIATALELIKEGTLGYNVTFLIEGDEESGGSDMKRFIEDHREELKCDFVLVSDGEGIGTQPAFDISFRGVFNVEVKIRTAQNDVHSGIYGGIMQNAATLAGAFVEKVRQLDDKDTDWHPLYEDYQPAPEAVRRALPPFNAEEFRDHIGGVLTVPVNDAVECLGFDPSIEVTGISSGYAGEGFRNAIPAEATVKLNVRVGPEQDSAVCSDLLSGWMDDVLWDLMPEGTSWDISIPLCEDGVILWSADNEYLQVLDDIVKEVTGKPAYLRPCGGSIPIMTFFDRLLSVPMVSLSLGNSDCNMHGVDENLSLVCVEQGLAISREFFSKE